MESKKDGTDNPMGGTAKRPEITLLCVLVAAST